MKLPFLDREDELRRLRRALGAPGASLAVVYGRRRCGKSTLLQQALEPGDVYFLADQREARLQIRAFASAVQEVIPGFAAAEYSSWDAVFTALISRLDHALNVFIDEFPYLVQASPELPSILQRVLDAREPGRIRWILCGSSQRMMQGAVLDRTAPLYGRAQEILKIRPLNAGWITDALDLDAVAAVEAYAIWGGVPRYWELAKPYETTEEAMADLVLDRNGVLHEEPSRLLRDDMRSSTQSQSVLSLIGGGCHRLSEISARLGKPSGSLTRVLAGLMELGYVNKELPWGESPRSTKRALWRVADPFMQFYFRFVLPNRSLLEVGQIGKVESAAKGEFPSHVGGVWEQLARASVSVMEIGGVAWRDASRWWGHDTKGRPIELDVVAESSDRKSLLIGEAKWGGAGLNGEQLVAGLEERTRYLPFIRSRSVVFAFWSRRAVSSPSGIHVVTPDSVIQALR